MIDVEPQMLSFLEEDDVALLSLPPAPRRAILRAIKAAALSLASTYSGIAAPLASTPMQRGCSGSDPRVVAAAQVGSLPVSGYNSSASVAVGQPGGGEGDGDADKMCLDPITMVRLECEK
jgi:hypothetical protein